jgi:hypothetical protein
MKIYLLLYILVLLAALGTYALAGLLEVDLDERRRGRNFWSGF